MDSFTTNKDKLFEKVENYATTSVNLLKLNAVEKSADVISSLSHRIVLLLVVAMFTLFINVGVSMYIGKLLNEYYLGFFIVSSFYLLFAVFIYIFRNKFLKTPISNMVITKLLKKVDLDEVLKTNNQ
ncbi:MAG: hypothetical protein ACK4M1_00280 [Flavobacterium sp.]